MSHSIYTSTADQKNDMYFGTEVINRVSFLREDTEFITNAINHPSARFVAFKRTDPLINKSYKDKLLLFTNGDRQIPNRKGLNSSATGGAWGELLQDWSRGNASESASLRDKGKPVFVFLGLEDESVGLKLKTLKSVELEEHEQTGNSTEKYLDHQGRYQGIPYFAVDVTGAPAAEKLLRDAAIAEATDTTVAAHFTETAEATVSASAAVGTGDEDPSSAASQAAGPAAAASAAAAGAAPTRADIEEKIFFTRSRKHYLGFSHKEAALYSHGKMYLDWLSRNTFCPGCGTKVIPIHAGGKLKCTNSKKVPKPTPELPNREVYECPVKSTSVSNVSFPRTDAVIITAITNTDRTKVLLSLSKRHAATRMYACTAGFMEPSETVEVATKREIWEETGVMCSKINIILTQPWPFPANLMIGCIGVVDFNGTNEVIQLDHDKELADARWFDCDTIRSWIYDNNTSNNPEGILLPSPESIAFQLIKLVVADPQQTKL